MPASNKNQKRGLGRGFDSLIPTDLLDESFDPTADKDQQVSELRNIRLDQISADPDQPRRKFDEAGLEELSQSIKEHGVLQPIIVTPTKKGYQIVAGERRYRASIMAKLDKIPALVRTLSGQKQLEISLIENIQRKDLNPVEMATAYLKLRDQFNLTLEEIAKNVGANSISAVSNRLRLLKLPTFMRELLADGQLTEGQARPLIGLDNDVQKKIVARIIKENWSSRRTEQFIVDYKKNQAANLSRDEQLRTQPYKKQLNNLKLHLKTDVHITTNSKGAGSITIRFKDKDEFERLETILTKD